MAVARELPGRRSLDYSLVVDGVPEHRQALLVAVANTASFGGGMRIAPDADPGDGVLDLVVVAPLPAWELARVFPRVFSGTHVDHPAVEVRRVREVELAAEGDDLPVYGDGERLGTLPLRVGVRPGGLRVLA